MSEDGNNGIATQGQEKAVPQVDLDMLQAVTQIAKEKADEATPEQIRAYGELFIGILSAPAVAKAVEAWGAAKQAEQAAKVEAAKAQSAASEAAHRRQAEVAQAFLKGVAVLGLVGMASLVAFAWLKILDGQAFGVLAGTFFTVLFGSGLYGTSLRNKS